MNMSYGKMSDFVSFLLSWFTLVIKLITFDFESQWNALIFLIKNIWRQIWIWSLRKCLILFYFHFLGQIRHKTEKFRFWKSLKYFNTFWWNTIMSDLNTSCQTALLFELNFGNKLKNANFKLYWNSLIFFN